LRVRGLLQLLERAPVVFGLLLALLIEAVTALLRFGLGMRAADYEHLLTRPTFGIRMHHGYLGLAFLAAGVLMSVVPRFRINLWRSGLLILGIGLLISDALHHLVVLKLATGGTEFP
jgi:hypothetical protein